jgi:hypothetical protein
MIAKETVKKTILKLELLCESYEEDPSIKLEDLEETVVHLSHEIQTLDIAADQNLKKELNTLQSALVKLSSVLKKQQKNIEQRAQEIYLHQRALYAYAHVANNNLGSLSFH